MDIGWLAYVLIAMAILVIACAAYSLCATAGDEGQDEELTEEYFQKLREEQLK